MILIFLIFTIHFLIQIMIAGKVLISGGAGFIGSNLALRLLQKGYKVVILDNLSPKIHGHQAQSSYLFKNIAEKTEFIKGDVTSSLDWDKALEGVNIVIHFAAETGTGQSMYEVYNYVNTNISGSALLLDHLANKTHSVSKVIVASSRSIYGEGKYLNEETGVVYPGQREPKYMDKGDFEVKFNNPDTPLQVMPTDEESRLHPSSIYGITKLTQEQMIMTLCPGLGIAPVSLRFQNVYGPGQSLKNPYTGILSIFSTQIKNNKTIKIFEDGKESRDFVYIDDVVDATILGIENPNAEGQIFNVGSGVPTTVMEVASQLIKNYNANVGVEITGQYRIGDIRHNFADLKKIRSHLGFTPKISFEEGIKRFTNWVDSQDVEEDNYDASIAELKLKGLFK